MGLPFVSMCPRFLTRQPPNCRISGEVATNARYPEKCVSEVLPDPTLRFLRTPKKLHHLIPSFCVYTHSSESVHVPMCPCHCMRTRVSLHVCSIGVSDRFRHKPRLTSSFYSVVLRLHAFFGKCTRSRVPFLVFVCVHTCLCLYALQAFRIVSGTSQNCNLCQCFFVDFKRQRIGSAAGAKSAECSEKCMLGLLNEDPELRSVEPKTRRV